MKRHLPPIAVPILLALSLAACGSDSGTVAADDPGAASTVFAVTDHGGFVPIEVAHREAPRLVVLSDGTVFRPAPRIEIFPPAALPAVESTMLDDQGLRAVSDLVADHAALFDDDVAHPGAADAPFTVITGATGVELESVVVPLLLEAPPDDADPATRARHDQAAALVSEIEAVVADASGEWVVGPPPVLRIRSIPTQDVEGIDPGPARPFPLPTDALGLDSIGPACLDVEGDELSAVVDASGDASEITPWIVGDDTVQLVMRPLYPHEPGCDTGPLVPDTAAPAVPDTAAPALPDTAAPAGPTSSTAPATAQAEGAGCTPGAGALGDGRWYGYVTEARRGELDLDLACWFTGEAATRAAAEDGAESPPPNDYHVRNTNPVVRTSSVAAGTAVHWYPQAGDPTSETTITYVEWVAVDRDPDVTFGVWVTITGGVVVDVQEQWVP